MINYLLATEGSVFNSQLWAAIISAGVSIVIGLVSGIFTAQKAKMNFYSSTVSKERVEWINKTREIASELIAFCAMHTEDELAPIDVYQFEKLRSALLMRISPKVFVENKHKYLDTDGEIIGLLEEDNYQKIRDSREDIRRIITVICKNEWNRIRAEAGGTKNIEKKIEKYNEKYQ